MSTALTERPGNGIDPALVEQVLIRGDLKSLTPAQKVSYYNSVCQSLGLNPLTQPFAYITLNGKEVLYAKRDAAEQLRRVHRISIDPKSFTREVIEGVYVVTAAATTPDGRTDVSTGAVPIDGLKGENRANAMMKAETKAKRRVTLSICGLGMLDETEVETIPQPLTVQAPKAERPTPPTGWVYLERVESKRWGAEVTLSDGEVVYARDPRLVTLCEQIAQEGAPVMVDTKPTPKGKVELVAVHRTAPQPEATAVSDLPITADQIPF